MGDEFMSKIAIARYTAILLSAVFSAASAAPSGHPTSAITSVADDTRLTTLRGNTRPEATAENDQGAVADAMPLEHMQLQLKRTPEREAALQQYIADLHNPQSSSYHQWLSPSQFATHYGVAGEDVAAVSSWLIAKGFRIDGVAPTGLTLEFSGTAGLVKSAFHTVIHNLNVNGAAHYANMRDPMIPAALAPAVVGLGALHDFHAQPKLVRKVPMALRPNYTYNNNGPAHLITPGDLATIYNLTPLFAAGYSGKGQTIMVIEDSYLYSTTDWTAFRKTFGLARAYPFGTLTQVAPAGAMSCVAPPANGDDGEAAIDVEWASAAAPNAAIVLAACTDRTGTPDRFGGFIALQNVLNGPVASLPTVVSISYGDAEASIGAASNAAILALYQQAVAEGVSIFVSSGDENAASADNGAVSTHGIGVSGYASTPYNVAVGGTDFGYTANNIDPSVYWNATNSSSYSSALSYIQEIPWNDSCAGSLVAASFGTTPAGLCAQAAAAPSGSGLANLFLDASVGGSGGPSGCATGAPTTSRVVSGTCAGYPKPSWQAGLFGNPNDGVRDIPDVALFASNGFWDAYYVTCYTETNINITQGDAGPCNGPPSTWAGFGGTSVSAPIMAAIQALVNQKTGMQWGNPNPVYYQMAQNEYGAAGNASCNSTTVNKSSNSCVFYDVTQGDITSACKADRNGHLQNCYLASGTIGLLSTSNSVFQPAYPSTTGWDFATGIGSVNAYNLVMSWPTP
jgi:subtilase family serine protease